MTIQSSDWTDAWRVIHPHAWNIYRNIVLPLLAAGWLGWIVWTFWRDPVDTPQEGEHEKPSQ